MRRNHTMRKSWVVLLQSVLFTLSPAGAEAPRYDEGVIGLALALRKLPVTASLLQATAHPDDEDNPLLVMLGRGRGIRTGLMTLTRGDGGQNEIGPELFEALGIIRTEELMRVHRYDGAEQFFSKAYEFGYSFSVEETLEKWGREEILEDLVRVIRRFRPDVMVALPRTGRGGGQHHQASALLTAEAFRAAADPGRFPEQIAEGLRPWQARKLYERRGWSASRADLRGSESLVNMSTGRFEPLLARTYAQIGQEARASHRCQGMAQIVPPPGSSSSAWLLMDSAIQVGPAEEDLFEGIDVSLQGLLLYAEGELDQAPFLASGLGAVEAHIEAARQSFSWSEPGGALPNLAQGLEAVRHLRDQIRASSLSDRSRYELDFRLQLKEADFSRALQLAAQLTVDIRADDGTLVPGQEVALSVTIGNGGTDPIEVLRIEPKLPVGWSVNGGDAGTVVVSGGDTLRRELLVRVSEDAKPTRPHWRRSDETVDRYEVDPEFVNQPWGTPEVTFEVLYRVAGTQAAVSRSAEYAYAGPWAGGEQRQDVMVVPEVSLVPEPRIGILPLQRVSRGREVRVTVSYEGVGPLQGSVRLEVPPGWTTSPVVHEYVFSHQGESLTRAFQVQPAPGVAAGEFRVVPVGLFGGQTYREGYQVIDYDHIRRRHYYLPSDILLKTFAVESDPELKIGYVEGVGDEVAEAIAQLGLSVHQLDSDDLTFGNLDEYEVIVTGVRAYLARPDLRANHQRLLDWVKAGGVMIVQYNKLEFNGDGEDTGDSPFAPYPARVGRGRVTDEKAPIRVLDPGNPVFRSPNRIDDSDWDGWVQERGLYFLGEKDQAYRDLVSTGDPFPYNAGEKLGSLVEADYGKGKWIYVGLGLWRQLPAGVPGAYRLLSNLLSLPRTR